MSNSELRANHSPNADGIYPFDPVAIWVVFVGGLFLAISLAAGAIVIHHEEHHSPRSAILVVLASLMSLGGALAAANILQFRGRTVRLTDAGISVHDRQGNRLESLQWSELGRVTERRRLEQIVLWDKLGARRVAIDHQYKNYAAIRSRILEEYAKVFTPRPLPFEFGNSPDLYETLVFAGMAAVFAWTARLSYRQGQLGGAVFLYCMALLALISILRCYPQLRGPSILSEDRIVLRRLFKTEQLYKNDITSIEITDVANPKSGMKFSLVVLHAAGGKELKINSIYGSIPEIYLTLLAWLAHR